LILLAFIDPVPFPLCLLERSLVDEVEHDVRCGAIDVLQVAREVLHVDDNFV
jgi:hypothetical protein